MSRFIRNWRSLACLAIATVLLGVALGLLSRAEDSPAEVVLIHDGSSVPNPFLREKFTALGVEVLDTYGTFVLAAVSSEQRTFLE